MADVGVANQALGHAFGIQPGQLREGASDQQLRYAHAKAASDEFQAEHQAGAVQLGPKRRQALLDLLDRQVPQWQQMGFDPAGEAVVARVAAFRNQQGNGFGQVANGLVALLEKPVRQPRQPAGQLP